MNKLEIFYAKLVFKTDTQKRMAVSRKVASLLRNNFTLMDALHRIEMIESKNGQKPNEPFAIAMREIQKNLERGMTFAEATSGWVPSEETLLFDRLQNSNKLNNNRYSCLSYNNECSTIYYLYEISSDFYAVRLTNGKYVNTIPK